MGWDVHARKVVARVLDAASGELRMVRVPAGVVETTAWLSRLPAPVRVAYEAGPTGLRTRACLCSSWDRVCCSGAVEDPARVW